ncbi:unnamed protein product [Pieris macdunnoughi]|uniref:Uncharacterized protein n=1 Tax=Pieris macdunnoughi TaxID=345717 RepID=A0A821RJF2_9NEOP|nr:unnamed protein product [Pieris macdunnoughi]
MKGNLYISSRNPRAILVSEEVERLLREYTQNQELVRNIGAHYYQIIYPVQLRHHEKMGISTREVNTPKTSKRGLVRVSKKLISIGWPLAINRI